MLPKITEGLIRQHASTESFRRGQDYFVEGAVSSLARRGDVLEAEVEGSQPWPYEVRIEFDEGGILEVACSCPYDWGGWCKHTVAVLLAYIDQPEAIEKRPTLESLLGGLDRCQLQTLLLKLIESKPGLAEEVESQIALLQPVSVDTAASEPTTHRPRQTSLDPEPFRRQVRSVLHSLDRMRPSDAYWHVGEVVNQVSKLVDQALGFVAAGDGRNALVILDAITEEYIADWEGLDDSDGEASGFFEDLGRAWAETFLSTDLTSEERQTWSDKLCTWTEEVQGYGMDDAFDVALQAVDQGWDFPPLSAVLRGEFTEEAETKLRDLDWNGTLTSIRLGILERQGRNEEYLNLAQAAGQMGPFTLMLVKLGRIDEAVEEGLRSLVNADEALALAQRLREMGALEGALRVGEHGLELPDHGAGLAEWVIDLATGTGNQALALKAALVSFQKVPRLAAYLRVQELAGDRWPGLRLELLDYLRQKVTSYAEGKVDVFLHEGLVVDAIAVVEGWASDSEVEKVVEAATESHPDWVIQTCRRRAEAIMDRGKADHYDKAVNWLSKARKAYHASGRQAEWRQYRQDLLSHHGRKYKLVPMLKALKD